VTDCVEIVELGHTKFVIGAEQLDQAKVLTGILDVCDNGRC